MSEYTPFRQQFGGSVTIEDYKRHLTTPTDPCSTCYYYPDDYYDCSACGVSATPVVEFTGFEFDDTAIVHRGITTQLLGRRSGSSSYYPLAPLIDKHGSSYWHGHRSAVVGACMYKSWKTTAASTITGPYYRKIANAYSVGDYIGVYPWPLNLHSSEWRQCPDDVEIGGPEVWMKYFGSFDCSQCNNCPSPLLQEGIAEPKTRMSAFATIGFNQHFATCRIPGKSKAYDSSFTLPPGMFVVVTCQAGGIPPSCYGCYCYSPRGFFFIDYTCFRLYHIGLSTGIVNDTATIVNQRLMGQNSIGPSYHLNCNFSGKLNLVYESTNSYDYYQSTVNLSRHSHSYNSRPGCTRTFDRSYGYGDWNGGDGTVTVTSQTATVIPVNQSASVGASASGTASVG